MKKGETVKTIYCCFLCYPQIQNSKKNIIFLTKKASKIFSTTERDCSRIGGEIES